MKLKKFLALTLALVTILSCMSISVFAEDPDPMLSEPLTFTSTGDFTVILHKKHNAPEVSLQYSFDKSTWNPLSFDTKANMTYASVSVTNPQHVVYFRAATGKTNDCFCSSSDATAYHCWEFIGGSVAASGNIMYLLSQTPTTEMTDANKACFSSMFSYCSNLTQAPLLPATKLAINCYAGMFNECTGLKTAPALPAESIANSCYYNMFKGCSSLTAAPALPARELMPSCYESMFQDCTSLVEAPALPATTLAEKCYFHMFHNCTKLVKAP